MAAADKTRAELVTQALVNLTVIGSGQSPDAEDSETVDEKVDGLIAELASRDICDVVDDDAIPSEWFNALADCLAVECATAFGRAKDGAVREDAEARLKIMSRQEPLRLLVSDRMFNPRLQPFRYR